MTIPRWRARSAGTPTPWSRAGASCAAARAGHDGVHDGEAPRGRGASTVRTVRIDAEVCVIGAGAGGAVAAAELAEGGMSVALLEVGHWHDPDGFTARPPEMLAKLYRDASRTVTLGTPPIL